MNHQAIKIKLISIFILCIINERYLSSSYAQANAVAQQQQISANNNASISSSNSLPALSERANGLNSRYLSAGSTASLAAATVAAANQTPQQQLNNNQNQQHQGPASQHQHQSQQQQQHQISANQLQAAAGNNGVQVTHTQASSQSGQTQQPIQVNNGLNGNNPIASQYSTAPVQQQPTGQLGSSVLSGGGNSNNNNNNNNNNIGGGAGPLAPVVSSTYAYNPLNGQYEPADLSSVVANPFALGQPQQQQSVPIVSQPFPITGQSNNNYPPQSSQQSFLPGSGLQQQQQQQLQQAFLASQNNFVNSRSPQRFASSGQTYYPAYGAASNGQFVQNSPFFFQQPGPFNRHQQQSFTRRTGQQAGGGTRNQVNYVGLDDDSNGLFQQQQVSSVSSLADQLAASLGLNLDPSYVSSTGPTYNQQQHGLDSHNGFVSQSSSGQPGGLSPSQSSQNNNNNNNYYNYNNAVSGSEHKSDQCVAADGRHGTCYQASECIRRGGTPMGRCGSSSSSSGSGAGGSGGAVSSQSSLLTAAAGYNLNDLSGSSHVCCLFDVTCGQFAAERFVYFRNPGYPNTFDQSRMCRAKIGKLDKGVCEFRLDLLRFDIAKPTNGNCSHDMFVVSGQNENYVLPKICGLNDGQHYYIGVDESGVITLHMMMMGYYRRSFEILVTQIPCRSDFAAPAHCLQYYMGTHGTIKSFNYDDEIYSIAPGSGNAGSFVNYELQQDGSSGVPATLGSGNGIGLASAPYGLQFANNNNNNGNNQLQQRQLPQQQFISSPVQSNRYQLSAGESQFGGYPNDLDYTICIRKESGFCSITYQLSRSEQGLAPFAVGQSPSYAGQNDTIGGGGGLFGTGSVSTECRDDYLLIGGVRLCSGNQFGGGQSTGGQSFYDTQTGGQFGQNNNSIYGLGAGANIALQQQQLQNQQAQLMQQLNRLQQQQQQQFALIAGNVSAPGLNGNGNQQQNGNLNGSNNLDQQQAAIVQQLMIIQQQLNSLGDGGNYPGQQQSQFNGKRYQQGDGQHLDLQGAIITDTTSGPFLLRFVSNTARNARGFHIDYRQNPCK